MPFGYHEFMSMKTRADLGVPAILKTIAKLGLGNKIVSKKNWKSLQVSVTYVNSAEMTKLNSRYRKKRKPTDVLSFPAPISFQLSAELGDIVICENVAKKQAKQRGHSLKDEATILLVHGILHLIGYDHERSLEDAESMKRAEGKILGALGGDLKRGLL